MEINSCNRVSRGPIGPLAGILKGQSPLSGPLAGILKGQSPLSGPLAGVLKGQGPLSLYFHVPFCTKKCPYCHFYVLPEKDGFKQLLMEGFRLEWDRWKAVVGEHEVCSVYFGGGTPSLMGPEAIGNILQMVGAAEGSEITLEANPENVTKELLKEFAGVGINRLSLGVQSFDDGLLRVLGRIHDGQKAVDAVHGAYDAGIENISIDLMYDLPEQTLECWERTLQQASELPISHLSLYNLTFEPNTLFFKKKEELEKRVPSGEASLQMYKQAIDLLEKAGLKHYEISAFAKNDRVSRHNVGYWTGRPFLGFGPSAFSYWQGKRFRNVAHLTKYHTKLLEGETAIDFEEILDESARKRELLVVQMRLLEGVDLTVFEKRYGPLEENTYAILHNLAQKDWITFSSPNTVRLTHQGILFYDSLASELI